MVETDDRPTYAERIAALSVGGASLDLTEPRPLKLTVDDLVLLDRHWQDDDHHSIELIDGRIYFTPARYRPPGWIAGEISAQLRESATRTAPYLSVLTRGSVEISAYDLPLPDIVLTSEPHGNGFIPVASVPLVAEVAETALEFYMGEKLNLYARAGIPEYWVADVDARVIHRMWLPVNSQYTQSDKVAFGEPVYTIMISRRSINTHIS